MKINFIEASHIVDFIDHVYGALEIPAYVTYDYLSNSLKSDECIGRELNLMKYSGCFIKPLKAKYNALSNDKVATQRAMEHYKRFDEYYQKAKELQSFQIK